MGYTLAFAADIAQATPDLFAWTLTIVLISAACTRVLRMGLKRGQGLLERNNF